MASLYFRYSAMNAGKSTLLLQAAHNYAERGMDVLLLSPAIDDRHGVGKISSRIGLAREALAIKPEDDLFDMIELIHQERPMACVFIDESQFVSKEQAWQLSDVVDKLGVPVICYGLRTDAFGNLFEGSSVLLGVADHIEEVKTICHCGKKATMVVRLDEQGRVVKDGSQVEIGDNDRYISMCRKHYKEKLKCGEQLTEY